MARAVEFARAFARARGHFAAREALAAGIHPEVLRKLRREGFLEQPARGQYRLREADLTEHHGLAIASTAVERGVVCLISALAFHGIGTQLPHETWMALERGSRTPVLAHPRLRILRFSGTAFTTGIEEHTIEGRRVRIYSAAKTVADCFKFRNDVGLDVAIEALREGWRGRAFTIEDLMLAARATRMERVMTPYVDTVLA